MPEQLKDIKGVIYVFDWGTFLFFLLITLLLAIAGYFFLSFSKSGVGTAKIKATQRVFRKGPVMKLRWRR
jgi:flagellar basal body-associated protein FliL